MTNGDETYFEAYCNLEVSKKMVILIIYILYFYVKISSSGYLFCFWKQISILHKYCRYPSSKYFMNANLIILLQVHEKMLNDIHRNEAYRKAIITNEEYLKDKIVLDLGAGTGIYNC